MEILEGLKEFHKQGLIYTELCPENVLLDDKGHANLCDFGI